MDPLVHVVREDLLAKLPKRKHLLKPKKKEYASDIIVEKLAKENEIKFNGIIITRVPVTESTVSKKLDKTNVAQTKEISTPKEVCPPNVSLLSDSISESDDAQNIMENSPTPSDEENHINVASTIKSTSVNDKSTSVNDKCTSSLSHPKLNRSKSKRVRSKISSDSESSSSYEIMPTKRTRAFSKKRPVAQKADLTDEVPTSEEACKRIFTSSLELTPKIDLLSPTGRYESLYNCDVCQSVFDRIRDLEVHLKTHVKCKFCKKLVENTPTLARHMTSSCLALDINKPMLKLRKIDSDVDVVKEYSSAFKEIGIEPREENLSDDDDVIIIDDTPIIELDANDSREENVASIYKLKPDFSQSSATDNSSIISVSVVQPKINCINSQALPNILFRDNVMHLLFSKHFNVVHKSVDPIYPTTDFIKYNDGKVCFQGLFRDLMIWRIPLYFVSSEKSARVTYVPTKPKIKKPEMTQWSSANAKTLIRRPPQDVRQTPVVLQPVSNVRLIPVTSLSTNQKQIVSFSAPTIQNAVATPQTASNTKYICVPTNVMQGMRQVVKETPKTIVTIRPPQSKNSPVTNPHLNSLLNTSPAVNSSVNHKLLSTPRLVQVQAREIYQRQTAQSFSGQTLNNLPQVNPNNSNRGSYIRVKSVEDLKNQTLK